MLRIGIGIDTHRYVEGDKIILGGVSIPFSHGIKAHSDGDILVHAIADALLGAAALGSIGQHFPDSSPEFKNIDSRHLLRQVIDLLRVQDFCVNNVDATIVAEQPKLLPFITLMRENLAHDLQVEITQVNVKATTSEGMGFIGRLEGVSVHAVVLIESLLIR